MIGRRPRGPVVVVVDCPTCGRAVGVTRKSRDQPSRLTAHRTGLVLREECSGSGLAVLWNIREERWTFCSCAWGPNGPDHATDCPTHKEENR